jgi:hypothetical protein
MKMGNKFLMQSAPQTDCRRTWTNEGGHVITTHWSAPSSLLVKIERNGEASTFMAEGVPSGHINFVGTTKFPECM